LCGQQLGFGVLGVSQLVTAFLHFLILVQNAVHRAPGAQILAFIDQAGIHFPRRLIGKALTVEDLPDFRFLCGRQRTRRHHHGRGYNR